MKINYLRWPVKKLTYHQTFRKELEIPCRLGIGHRYRFRLTNRRSGVLSSGTSYRSVENGYKINNCLTTVTFLRKTSPKKSFSQVWDIFSKLVSAFDLRFEHLLLVDCTVSCIIKV